MKYLVAADGINDRPRIMFIDFSEAINAYDDFKSNSEYFEVGIHEVDEPNNSNWISVEYRLPEKDCVVFIFCQCIAYAAKEENSLYDMQIVGTYRKGNNKFTACVDSPLDGYKITHWRPQFEKPEGE